MKCTSATCSVPECAPTKALVTNHTRQCRAGDACTYPRCALSKRLMRHHRECPDQACPICLPLRRRLAAAKMNAQPQPSQQPAGPPRRKPSKRKKDDEDETAAAAGDAGNKRKRKEGGMGQNGMHAKDSRVGGKKRALAAGPAADAEQAIVAEYDVLESGFCVSVHFSNGRRQSVSDEQRG
eukprot:1074358-Prymnesium_polylepis.1